MTTTIESVPADLHCPLCDYDLRGLIEPRCPECGFGAPSWEILREQIRSTHPFLFEHHLERNVWSFLKTLVVGLLPWKFWRSVRPYHEIRLRRLIGYWLITSALALLPPASMFLVSARDHANQMNIWRPTVLRNWQASPREQQELVLREFGSFERALDRLMPLPPSWGFFRDTMRNSPVLGIVGVATLLCVVYPWLLVIAMRAFGQTLRAAKIKSIQILRCGIYSADIVAWLAPPLGAIALAMWLRGPSGTLGLTQWEVLILLAGGLTGLSAYLMISVKIAFAFRAYLGLRHAIATAVLVQIMIFLACAVLQLPFN